MLCAPDYLPDWYKKQAPGMTLGHFYSKELAPPRVTPGSAAAPPQYDNQDSTEYPEDEQRG